MIGRVLNRVVRVVFLQLPERPYPSNHPKSIHQDADRPRG